MIEIVSADGFVLFSILSRSNITKPTSQISPIFLLSISPSIQASRLKQNEKNCYRQSNDPWGDPWIVIKIFNHIG
jgi:hypothetical protein